MFNQNDIINDKDDSKALPFINIPLMSDFKWQYMALQDRLQHPEKYREIGEDVEAAINRLKRWLTVHIEKTTNISA